MGRPYFIARAGSAAVAGMTQVERRRPDELVAQWISYLSVSNVDSVVDPQGAPFGLVRLGRAESTTGWAVGAGRQLPLARLLHEGGRARATLYSNLAGLAATRQARPDLLVQYILTRSGPGPVAGVVPIGGKPIKPNWLPYVRVSDPAAVAARAEQLGGRIVVRASPEIRKGSVAVIVDASGAAVALQKWPF